MLEALPVLRVGRDRWFKHLERNVATQPAIARAVHLAHTAGADERNDVISRDLAAGQGRTRLAREGPRRFGECRSLEKLISRALVAEQRAHFLTQLLVVTAG